MTDLFAARSQMAMSLGFHMIFATVGMGMPLLMVLAEFLYLRTGNKIWLKLAKSWSKGVAILFAVGAVSGTVLSFELGLLWPKFMEFAGPVIGMPFGLEGYAFFFEAIFLGIYLYGWDRVGKWAHWLSGVGVALSGLASGMLVVTANGWMNTPTGFTLDEHGVITSVDPVAAILNPSAIPQSLHMATAAFLATALMVGGIHAWGLLKAPTNLFHRKALALALCVTVVFTGLQGATGHLAAETVAHNQPVKLAALEGLWETQTHAPFTIGGWVDEEAEETRYGIEIPAMLSILVAFDPEYEVMGLKDVPVDERPPVNVTHQAYQLMLACYGLITALAAAAAGLFMFTRRLPLQRWFLWLCVLAGPAGLVGIEAGWTATEVGRQPWVVHGILRTADAVTPAPGLQATFFTFTLLYVVLGVLSVMLLRRQFIVHTPDIHVDSEEGGLPHGA